MTAVVDAQILDRLDALTVQVAYLTEQAQAQAQSRQRWADLAGTMAPVTRGAMDMAVRELEELDLTTEELAAFGRTMARSLPRLQALMAQLEPVAELAEHASQLSAPALAKLTDVLADADAKGYFAFARQGARIADNVVTEFTEDDVRALGDNVTTILRAVKEMTQPEVMALVQRTAITMQAGEEAHAEPPSMLALLRQMRDPQTRRGLARVMSMLRSVGEDQQTQ
jgi:uncharacterized protein YjgD (DUF1641 family)